MAGDEGAIAGRGVRHDARAGHGALDARLDRASPRATTGEPAEVPAGSVTTTTTGALSPPFPYSRVIA